MRQSSPLTCLFAALASAVVSMGAKTAAAQQPPPPISPDVSPTAAPAATPEPPMVVAPAPAASAPTATVAASSAPAPAPAVDAPAHDHADDHASFVGHLAVGYLGISSLPIAAGGGSGGLPELGAVSAPVIGVRYWFRDAVGVDAGVGLGIQTGSAQPSAYGFALHAGLPIVLAHGRHTAFELTPEATVGYATGTIVEPVGGNASVGGFLARAGARAGAEVHFGFIGLPELALQATVGLYWRYEVYHFEQSGGAENATSTLITTSVGDSPWGIFTDTISALYYF